MVTIPHKIQAQRQTNPPLERINARAAIRLRGALRVFRLGSFNLALGWLDTFSQDLRFAIRQLRTNPGFTAVAVLSLGLGIGANTAIFQLVDAVRLRTLPVRAPQELATIDLGQGSMRAGWFSTRSARLTSTQWNLIRTQQQAFTATPAWSASRFNLSPGGEARYAEGLYVSGDYFSTLGVHAVAGRLFGSSDDSPGCNEPGAVVSHSFWQRELAGDRNLASRSVMLDGHKFPVIGVTEAGFFGMEVGRQFDIAIPLCADKLLSAEGRERATGRTSYWLSSFGRLKPGWTVQSANAHLRTISPGIMRESLPSEYRPDGAKRYLENKLTAEDAATGVSGLRRSYSTPLYMLMGITGLVLLIACANLANLLLARASVREREMAVRLALGAGRGKLIRQLMTESLLLAALGAGLGMFLSKLLSETLLSFLTTEDNPLFLGLSTDLRIVGFASLLACATCLLFGLLPAFRSTRLAPASAMRAAGRGLTAGKEKLSLRRSLVAVQVAISVVLLVGAILFAGSLRNLMGVDAGFRTEGVVSVSLDLRRAAVPKEQRMTIFRNLMDRLSTQPGVISAAQVDVIPVSGSGWNSRVRAAGSNAEGKNSLFNRISPGYFRTMSTPIVAGRDFNDHDTLSAPKVAIVSEAFAKQFFGAENPVGKTFFVEGRSGQADDGYEVVGVARNTKYYELREDFQPIAFFPTAQEPNLGLAPSYVLHIAGAPAAVLEGVKATLAQVHPNIGIEIRALNRQVADSLLRDRLMAALSTAFGVLAAMLSALGLYGVIAYMVERRRNEIGVRMALGASRGHVIGLVVREAGIPLVSGMLIGALCALWAGQTAASMLFGLKPHDPMVMAVALGLLSAVALLACLFPARRAAGLNPVDALRDE
ncbi:MAG: ABC transporter permease [Acidobacteria bacterium]|nr:ABC transporter permease [Acidobacteriota bacterium]